MPEAKAVVASCLLTFDPGQTKYTLTEELLAAAFGEFYFQRQQVAPSKDPCAKRFEPEELFAKGSKSLFALDALIARGYSQRSEMIEHIGEPDAPARIPHGHCPRGW